MEIIIVGKRGEKRVIRWSRAVGLALVIAVIMGSGGVAGYRVLAGVWDLQPAFLGVLGAVVVVGVGTLTGLKTPLDKLRTIE